MLLKLEKIVYFGLWVCHITSVQRQPIQLCVLVPKVGCEVEHVLLACAGTVWHSTFLYSFK